jgi:ribose transport system substrate-binding protein
MKKILALLLAVSMALAVAGCAQTTPETGEVSVPTEESSAVASGSEEEEPIETDPADSSAPQEEGMESGSISAAAPPVEEEWEPVTFAYSGDDTDVEQQLQLLAETNGDTMITAQEDYATQAEEVTALLTQDIDALFLSPRSQEDIEELLTLCQGTDIPVFGFGNWGTDPEGLTVWVMTDEYNAGYVCGEDLTERLLDGGNIVVLEQTDDEDVSLRVMGFMDAAEELGVPFEVVGELDAQGDQELALHDLQDVLTAHPDVVAVFAGSSEMALGAQAAAEAAGSDCLIYSGDASKDTFALLQEGKLAGLGTASPALLAENLTEIAHQYLDGEDVAMTLDSPVILVTAENAGEHAGEWN